MGATELSLAVKKSSRFLGFITPLLVCFFVCVISLLGFIKKSITQFYHCILIYFTPTIIESAIERLIIGSIFIKI